MGERLINRRGLSQRNKAKEIANYLSNHLYRYQSCANKRIEVTSVDLVSHEDDIVSSSLLDT